MGVDLSWIDWETKESEWKAREKELYELAIDGDDVAKQEILLGFERGILFDKEIQAELIRDARAMFGDMARKLPGEHAKEARLSNILLGDGKRKPGAKASESVDRLLELYEKFGVLLTVADMKEALTTLWVKLPRGEKPTYLPNNGRWKKTVRGVEEELVTYVRERKFKKASIEAARRYVHASYPGIPWDKPGEAVDYPAGW